MRIQVLDKAKKKRFVSELKDFEVEKISGMLIKTGKERASQTASLSDRSFAPARPPLAVRPLRCQIAENIRRILK